MLRRVIAWTFVIIVAAWFIRDPSGAAALVNRAWAGVQNAGNSLATFVTSLGG
jgi:hypothetical protein